MPKVVDRDGQRREIGAALLSLIAERGMDEVSVRTVAAKAGRSAGAVQKYFRTKDEMLTFALDLAGERTVARMEAVAVDNPPPVILRDLVMATLPLDEPRRSEALVWTAFTARAAHHPGLAAILHDLDRRVHEDLTVFLERAGLTHTPSETADAVIALADGLAARMLYTPDDVPRLLAALDVGLAGLV